MERGKVEGAAENGAVRMEQLGRKGGQGREQEGGDEWNMYLLGWGEGGGRS